jgi:tetratricopeptide (TPR) repeat protein
MRMHAALGCLLIVFAAIAGAAVSARQACSAEDNRSPQRPPLELEDPLEPLVPRHAATEAEKNQLEALSLFAAGRNEEQRGNFASALRFYQRALRYDPTSLPILREVIEVARNLERISEATRYALMAVELDPTDPELIWTLAQHMARQSDFDGALKLYEKARSLQTNKKTKTYIALTLEMGRLYYLTDEMPKAADAFSEVFSAIEKPKEYGLDAKSLKALVGDENRILPLLGDAFLEANRPADALRAFDRAQKVSPDRGIYGFHVAQVLERQKQPAQALEKLQAYFIAHEVQEDQEPYELLEKLLTDLGRKKDLVAELEKLRAADPSNAPLRYFLADQYKQAGQGAQAETLYRDLLRQAPRVEAYRGLIEVYRQTSQADSLLNVMGEAAEKTGGLEVFGKQIKAIAGEPAMMDALIQAARTQAKAKAGGLPYGESLAMALISLDAKRLDAAREFFEATLSAKPKSADETLLLWGLGLLSADHTAEAAEVFGRGVAQHLRPADDPTFYNYLAVSLELSGKTEEALNAARKAAQIGNHTPLLESRIPWILYHAKRYGEAAKGYRELIARFDGAHKEEVRRALREARLSLSNIYVTQNHIPQAEEVLEQVLDEYPEDVSAMNDLGYLWADQGKNLGRALQMIQAAVESDPDNVAYRDSLGWAMYKLGRFTEAVAELRKATADKDPDGVIMEHLGDAYLGAKQLQAARDAWQRSVEILRKQGEPEKAQKVQLKLEQHREPGAGPREEASKSRDSSPSTPADQQQ